MFFSSAGLAIKLTNTASNPVIMVLTSFMAEAEGNGIHNNSTYLPSSLGGLEISALTKIESTPGPWWKIPAAWWWSKAPWRHTAAERLYWQNAPIAIALHGMILTAPLCHTKESTLILSVDDFHMFVILCMYINHNQNVCIYYIHDSSWFYLLGSGKTCSTIALDQALYSTLISAAQAQFGTRGGNAWRPDESWQVQGSKELSGFQGSQDMFNTISDRSCGLQLLCSSGGIQLGPASHDSRRHWTFKKVQTLRLLSDRRASHTCVSRTADVKVYFPSQ